MARARKWTDEELIEAVKTAKSIKGVMNILGTSCRPSVDRRIQELNLSTSHFKWRRATGIKQDGAPNAWWRRFKERLDAYDSVPVDQWTAEHVLGHILKRYRDFYGVDFTLSYTRSPTKSSEMYCVKRMMAALGSESGELAKQYIDWVFDNAIEPKNTNIRSVAFFFTGTLILRFKSEYRKMMTITRTTPLPAEWVNIGVDLGVTISTYGDLAFAKMTLDYQDDEEVSGPYLDLFRKLKDKGFDPKVLENLES